MIVSGLPKPSYKQGFAPRDANYLHPHLLLGAVGCWCPELGPNGDEIEDLGPNKFNADASLPDWDVNGDGWALEYTHSNSDFTLVADAPEISNFAAFSASVWFNCREINHSADQETILSKWDNLGAGREFLLNIETDGAISFDNAAGTPVDGSILSANTWYHVLVTYLTSSRALRLYLDGVLDISTTDDTRGQNDSADDFCFGARRQNGSNDQFFDGWIGSVILWDRILDASEARQVYELGRAGLFAIDPTLTVKAPAAPGGLSIPIAAYHYNHHLGSMSS